MSLIIKLTLMSQCSLHRLFHFPLFQTQQHWTCLSKCLPQKCPLAKRIGKRWNRQTLCCAIFCMGLGLWVSAASWQLLGTVSTVLLAKMWEVVCPYLPPRTTLRENDRYKVIHLASIHKGKIRTHRLLISNMCLNHYTKLSSCVIQRKLIQTILVTP